MLDWDFPWFYLFASWNLSAYFFILSISYLLLEIWGPNWLDFRKWTHLRASFFFSLNSLTRAGSIFLLLNYFLYFFAASFTLVIFLFNDIICLFLSSLSFMIETWELPDSISELTRLKVTFLVGVACGYSALLLLKEEGNCIWLFNCLYKFSNVKLSSPSDWGSLR